MSETIVCKKHSFKHCPTCFPTEGKWTSEPKSPIEKANHSPEHSPEPWSIHPYDPTIFVVPDNPPFEIGECCANGKTDLDAANTERIVACVNFCATIPTEELNHSFLAVYKSVIEQKTRDIGLLQMQEHSIGLKLSQICEENKRLREELKAAQEDLKADVYEKKFLEMNRELEKAKAEIARLKGEWISVEERLPGCDLWDCIGHASGYVRPVAFVDKRFVRIDDESVGVLVTHWRELPPPPTQKASEEK